jgi:hypothetical protein
LRRDIRKVGIGERREEREWSWKRKNVREGLLVG